MGLERIYDPVVQSQAGIWSFMAPDFKGVMFVYEPGVLASLTLQFANGETHQINTVDNIISLEKDSAWVKANPAIMLSHAPMRIEPMMD